MVNGGAMMIVIGVREHKESVFERDDWIFTIIGFLWTLVGVPIL